MVRSAREGPTLAFSLRRTSRKKTIAVQVRLDGGVVVLAPQKASRDLIRRVIRKRSGWIMARKNYFEDLLKIHPPKEFKSGESFPLLGRNLRLMVIRKSGLKRPCWKVDGRRLLVFVNGDFGEELRSTVQHAVQECYATHTLTRALTSVKKHAPALGAHPNDVRVVEQVSRWASCSKSGNIRLNWRLSMMRAPVLEYVVVHELCHLKAPDHSVRFWRMLKSVLPDYEERRDSLRRDGVVLATTFPGM